MKTLSGSGFGGLPALSPEQRKRKRAVLARASRAVRVGRGTSVVDLVTQYADAGIQARALGGVAMVLERMLADRRRPTVYLGLAGPLIAAGLRRVIRDLIDAGVVDVVVSTGAILYPDLYQARGGRHYRGTPRLRQVTRIDSGSSRRRASSAM